MEKKLIILLILLSGCRNDRTYACSRYSNDDSITINLNAVNDTILAFHVREAFKLPHKLLYDEEKNLFWKASWMIHITMKTAIWSGNTICSRMRTAVCR